jgi:hypothetical protein
VLIVGILDWELLRQDWQGNADGGASPNECVECRGEIGGPFENFSTTNVMANCTMKKRTGEVQLLCASSAD